MDILEEVDNIINSMPTPPPDRIIIPNHLWPKFIKAYEKINNVKVLHSVSVLTYRDMIITNGVYSYKKRPN